MQHSIAPTKTNPHSLRQYVEMCSSFVGSFVDSTGRTLHPYLDRRKMILQNSGIKPTTETNFEQCSLRFVVISQLGIMV